MEEVKKQRGRKKETTETKADEGSANNLNGEYEFSSWQTMSVSTAPLGLDIFSIFTPERISRMIKNPMVYNKELRMLSNRLYSANGVLTQCIDYCMAMPTLDYVVIPRGDSKRKRQRNKQLMVETLKKIRHKEVARDNLFKGMVEGIAFYYFETTEAIMDMKKTMSDYEVSDIVQINDFGLNAAIIPLPVDHTRIVGRMNSSYVLAFDMRYFEGLSESELSRKLKLYPKEIRDGWTNYHRNGGNNWLILNNKKTICTKIRSKIEEPWGRPLCLAAIKDILYGDFYKDTCRNTLNNLNSDVYVMTFPEGKDKAVCALTKDQQENQHRTVKSAIMNKNYKNSTSFVSVAAGTKLDHIERNIDVLNEENSSYIDTNIGTSLGFMANLLSGVGSGNYAAQQNNLQLLLSEILMWLEQFTDELVKVINENIIKDKKNPVGLYYLPCSHITRQVFTENMKDLYITGKGSYTAWVSSTGIDTNAYMSLMDMELEEGWEQKYPVHRTSYTLTSKDAEASAGRPVKTDSTVESTLRGRANITNDMPSPSDDK